MSVKTKEWMAIKQVKDGCMFSKHFFDLSTSIRCILLFISMGLSCSVFGQTPFFSFTQLLTDSVNDVDGLNGVNASAVSPDGKHLYVASSGDFSISLFRRNITTGEATFVQIWRDDIGGVEGLDGARHVVISPDGKHVYVAAANDETVTVFSRNSTTGGLSFLEIFDLGAENSGPVEFLAITPDGRDLFAITGPDGSAHGAVAQFKRDVTTGKLTWIYLYQDESLDGFGAWNHIDEVAVSPDGKYVYVIYNQILSVFRLNSANSELVLVEHEIHRDGASDGLGDPRSVVVSPDGKFIYVVDSSAIATYSRNASTGEIDFIEIDEDGVNGVDGLRGAIAAVINGSGSHIFVIAEALFDQTIVAFERNSTNGTLNFVTFIEQGDLDRDYWDALSDPQFISISPDGAYLNISNSYDNSLGIFKTASGTVGPQKFQINPGLNGSWFYPSTNGQGFLIDVFPDSGQMFLAWFTYDTDLPSEDAAANLGNAGQRWMTALGSYSDNQAVLDIYQAEGGLFDMSSPVPVQTMDGTVIVEFSDCNSGTITYNIPSIAREGVIPIQRIALDNVPLCEAFQ
jgi:6-phosphogluconolactonase (cycloisomerase 2 family)